MSEAGPRAEFFSSVLDIELTSVEYLDNLVFDLEYGQRRRHREV